MASVVSEQIVESSSRERIASCVCGGYRVVLSGDPIRQSICHCWACQQRTGSVFGVQARFNAAQVIREEGENKQFVRKGDEGNLITYKFCPTCGSTVSYSFNHSQYKDFVIIPVGVLCDNTLSAPVFSVYEARMHNWVQLPSGIEHMD